jgi:AdoMet-dependent heme synthase
VGAPVPLLDNGPALHVPRDFADCAPESATGDAYEALLRRLKRETVCYSAQWELTHACNLRCMMCYNEPLAKPELTTRECFDVLAQLADAGTLRLILTGGEILTRRDFFHIATEARRLGFALDLKTNGTLITPHVADRIAALTPLQVDISLLGARNVTVDAITGVSNTFDCVMRGVELLLQRKVRVKLNTLLMGPNIAEREAMLDLALGLGVQYEQVLKISPTDAGAPKAAGVQLSKDQMAEALMADGAPLAPLCRDLDARTCSVGLSSCLISPYGAIYPCVELRVPAGDLRRQSFNAIWRDAPVFQELRERHTVAHLSECRACALLTWCEGRCAGISWKETGDLYRGHTLACAHAQARFKQQNSGVRCPETSFTASNGSGAPRRASSGRMNHGTEDDTG